MADFQLGPQRLILIEATLAFNETAVKSISVFA